MNNEMTNFPAAQMSIAPAKLTADIKGETRIVRKAAKGYEYEAEPNVWRKIARSKVRFRFVPVIK